MLKRKNGSLHELAEDVRAFLDADSAPIRAIHDEILDELKKLGRVYIIGGLVRDIALHGPIERPNSDLDLVVRCHPGKLAKLADLKGATRNRFGGYGLKTRHYRVDFWAFSNTWAKRAELVTLRDAEDLKCTTFFNWDGVVYGLSERRVWAVDKYLHSLQAGVLEINLLENPSELGSLVRALRRLMMWDARPGPKLKDFILRAGRKFEWSCILATEANAFDATYLAEFDTLQSYLHAVVGKRRFSNLGMLRGRQPDIPQMHLPEVVDFKPIATEIKLSKVRPKEPKSKRYLAKDLFGNMR